MFGFIIQDVFIKCRQYYNKDKCVFQRESFFGGLVIFLSEVFSLDSRLRGNDSNEVFWN